MGSMERLAAVRRSIGGPGNEDIEQVRRAIGAGGDINYRDYMGQSALSAAASMGLLDTLRLLIEAGAEVNTFDNDLWTPLHWACWHGHHACILELLSAGADTELVDDDGQRPFEGKYLEENPEIADTLESWSSGAWARAREVEDATRSIHPDGNSSSPGL